MVLQRTIILPRSLGRMLAAEHQVVGQPAWTATVALVSIVNTATRARSTTRAASVDSDVAMFGKLLAKLGFTTRQIPDADGSLDSFLQSLAEAAAWGRSRVDIGAPQSCLRGAPFDSRTTEKIDDGFVSAVVDWRRKQVGTVTADSILHGGRLLAYFPDANLCDGAAEAESQGFLDLENCPPWQTWIALFNDGSDDGRGYGRYLVAWVPPQLLSLATAGIDVNPEECIVWLDSTRLPLAQRLAH